MDYSRSDSGDANAEKDASVLGKEIQSIHAEWPNTRIVLIGWSFGGLVAETYWENNGLGNGLTKVFSLDSPINGVASAKACIAVHLVLPACTWAAGYSTAILAEWTRLWGSLGDHDQQIATADATTGNSYIAIGTADDTEAYGGAQIGGSLEATRVCNVRLQPGNSICASRGSYLWT